MLNVSVKDPVILPLNFDAVQVSTQGKSQNTVEHFLVEVEPKPLFITLCLTSHGKEKVKE